MVFDPRSGAHTFAGSIGLYGSSGSELRTRASVLESRIKGAVPINVAHKLPIADAIVPDDFR